MLLQADLKAGVDANSPDRQRSISHLASVVDEGGCAFEGRSAAEQLTPCAEPHAFEVTGVAGCHKDRPGGVLRASA
jgi:hypothetical protein